MKTYKVCPTKDAKQSGVFCFAFDDTSLPAAMWVAANATRKAWELWGEVGCCSGFSGCEGLRLYVHESTNADRTEFKPICVYVQGKRYEPNHFE